MRWQDPAFPIAFPWFNTQHYWQNRILELREQIAVLQQQLEQNAREQSVTEN